MTSPQAPVWFITGCSTGFGRELATQVLARGWRAIVTARDRARVADLVRGVDDRALALDLDVTDAHQIAAAVAAAQARFGGIDVLVNNAGYGYQSSVEEGEEAQIRAQFDANVFGPFRTDWAGRSLKQTPNRIADYAATAGARLMGTGENSGRQPGDPVRAAKAMMQITEIENPPRHFVLGAFGVDAVSTTLEKRLAEIAHWREVSLTTDFPSSNRDASDRRFF